MVEAVGDASRDGRWALVRLVVEGERIISAEAEGLERPLDGLTLLEAAAVGGDELAVDALANALGPVFQAAVALLRAGPDAIGVTLRLWLDPQGPDTERACCSPAAVIAARATCHRLGIPHVTLDLREEFRRAVVEPFVRGYAAGETPNPCIRCNGSFRFAELLAFAERAGADRLATGHYARIVERDGRLFLARAADERKDQSYMLARLDPRFLDRLWFPLGEQGKDETRAEAAQAGLEVAQRAESQEACFLAGGDYRDFLDRHGLAAEEGPLVDEDGNEVGRHDGFWRFTPGQRKGLGVAAPEPLYALRSEATTNTVVVGPRAALATDVVHVRGRLHAPVSRAEVKLRYRSPAVETGVSAASGGFRLELDRPAYGVAPGQAAVLYDDGAVVGAGTIVGAETSRPASAF
jgi:tRNA-uridine 2-sulfurtransferase